MPEHGHSTHHFIYGTSLNLERCASQDSMLGYYKMQTFCFRTILKTTVYTTKSI